MTKVLVLLAPGFEEIEAVTVVDVLRRAGVGVTLAAIGETTVRGSHEIALVADARLADVRADEFDALVLPGGMPGAKHLREDPRVIELSKRFVAEGKLTAAICAAPTVLENAGVLEGRTATGYPGFALPSSNYVEKRVVEDGNVVTSRGPGTAMDFALKLVERLVGPEPAKGHRERLLA